MGIAFTIIVLLILYGFRPIVCRIQHGGIILWYTPLNNRSIRELIYLRRPNVY